MRKPGANDDAKTGEKVAIKPGQTASVRLTVESISGSIKGSVADADGKPVSDAYIIAARESDAAGANKSNTAAQTRWSSDDKPVLTTVEGAFTVTKLSPGNYTLRAFRKGGGEAVTEHVPVGGTAKLVIKHTGSIEGVAKRGSNPPDELNITLRDLKTGFWRRESFFRTQGKFTIHDLPAGNFQLTLTAAQAGEKQTAVDLTEGEQKTGVEIELDELITITGRVVDMVSKQPVAGMYMTAGIGKNGGGFSFSSEDEDRENVSDETGHFEIKNAPKGQITIRGFPKNWNDGDYAWTTALRDAEGTGTVDVGDIPAIKKRTKPGDTVGETGVHWVEDPQDAPIDKRQFKVSWIDPNGPAAKTELKVGDVVATIDGVDVTGANHSNGWVLLRAPVGTKLVWGLARGANVTIVLAAP
jgi:protocatechuate 3,4-dioxygenase beta subunit